MELLCFKSMHTCIVVTTTTKWTEIKFWTEMKRKENKHKQRVSSRIISSAGCWLRWFIIICITYVQIENHYKLHKMILNLLQLKCICNMHACMPCGTYIDNDVKFQNTVSHTNCFLIILLLYIILSCVSGAVLQHNDDDFYIYYSTYVRTFCDYGGGGGGASHFLWKWEYKLKREKHQ